MSLKQLPLETIKLISSAQVITSASSIVKELMENSIDAHATTIDIHLVPIVTKKYLLKNVQLLNIYNNFYFFIQLSGKLWARQN